MPPRKRISKVDDDFIDDEPIEPATKRAKASKAKNNEDKPISSTPSTKKQIDDEGNPFWELGGRLRRAAVSKYRGSVFVNIREHYEKDGQILPGKRGITLSVDQFNALMTVLPQLHATLAREAGSEIVMPAFGATAENVGTEDRNSRIEGDEEMELKEEEEDEMPKAKVKKDTKRDEPRVMQEAVGEDDDDKGKA